MRLTPAILSSFISESLQDVKKIELKDKEINHVDDISCCIKLNRIDLSSNQFRTGQQLIGLQYCESLTFLNLSNNQLEDLSFLPKLKNLVTLNLGNNRLRILSQHVTNCVELKALILNNNQLKTIDNILSLKNLNSLVLSHNDLEVIPNLSTLPNLTKLSISNNKLREFPPLEGLTQLKDLRLNNNKIVSVPSELINCPSLAMVGLSNNLIKDFSCLETLKELLNLKELTLSGNPVEKEERYEDKVKQELRNLRILDNKRYDPKFLERKEKMNRKKEIAKRELEEKLENTGSNLNSESSEVEGSDNDEKKPVNKRPVNKKLNTEATEKSGLRKSMSLRNNPSAFKKARYNNNREKEGNKNENRINHRGKPAPFKNRNNNQDFKKRDGKSTQGNNFSKPKPKLDKSKGAKSDPFFEPTL
ncbi:L domain-like protein [Neoconidiobolus thromboides FSU 785]|nr:L domain-like protein [Neoconidiobolus thromboides FSU 785]